MRRRISLKMHQFLLESPLSRLGKPDSQISSITSSSGTVYRDQWTEFYESDRHGFGSVTAIDQ